MEHELLDLTKWTEYIERLTKEFNALPEVPPILNAIEPTIFQYNLNDHPELNFWHAFDKNGIHGGMGENTEDKNFIKLIHKADFEVVRKVFNGELNPIEATMARIYLVEGDMAKLMACAPLLPLQVVAHEKVTGSTSGSATSAVCSTMEWEPKIKDLYDKIVVNMPEMVRPVIAPELFQNAEKKCEERLSKSVAEIDLIVALFEITPTAFQPIMKGDLKTMGVDYDRYLSKIESDFKCKNDLDQMVKDFAEICEFAGVTFNENAVWKTFNAYKEFFSGSPVSIRTTTKPVEKRDVALRYVEFFMPHDPDPFTNAINKGLIVKDDHPIYKMYEEAMDTFQMMGYGVDVDASTGFSKIWPFIVPGSIEPIFSMKYAPKSMKKYRDYFIKHDLTHFSLFAFDFLHKTTNIYFMLKRPPNATYESCMALVEDLGFELASKEAMEGCLTAAHLNYTFTWDSDICERLCFGMGCDTTEEVPVHFHPLMKEFVEKTPLQSDSRKFIWGVTFSNKGFYYKIENDYNGTMVDFIGMGCKAGIDSYK